MSTKLFKQNFQTLAYICHKTNASFRMEGQEPEIVADERRISEQDVELLDTVTKDIYNIEQHKEGSLKVLTFNEVDSQ